MNLVIQVMLLALMTKKTNKQLKAVYFCLLPSEGKGNWFTGKMTLDLKLTNGKQPKWLA